MTKLLASVAIQNQHTITVFVVDMTVFAFRPFTTSNNHPQRIKSRNMLPSRRPPERNAV